MNLLLLYHHFSKPSEGGNRCEIISDRYFDGSLEEGTRKKRGEEASRLIFNGETLIPKDFSEHFLRNSKTKKNKKKKDLSISLSNKFMSFIRHRKS